MNGSFFNLNSNLLLSKSGTKIGISLSNFFNVCSWKWSECSCEIKIPSSFGKHTQDKGDKVYKGGNLQLIHGSRMFLCKSTLNIRPKVGDFYFFPNYLMHTVFPFKDSNEERRSISFNANIDEDIYNVFGK